MSDHLDEMRFFLEVIQSYSDNYDQNTRILTEQVQSTTQEVIVEQSLNEDLLNDLVELKEKFLSITANQDDERLDEGFEMGMYKAAEMLENLLVTKHNRRI